jgi:hypothetical protein
MPGYYGFPRVTISPMTNEHVTTCLHTWAIVTPDADGNPVHNPVGVCGTAEQATQRVAEALQEAPSGAVGVVHSVPLNVLISLRHEPGRLVRSATLDTESGDLVWDPPAAW